MNREHRAASFIEMLLTLLDGSNTLTASLHILSRTGIIEPVRLTANYTLEVMRRGMSFSSAIESISGERKIGVYFSPLQVTLLASAEKTGSLVDVLRDMNGDFQRRKANRDMLHSALIYPSIIILLAFAGTLALLFMGIPLFVQSGMTSAETAQSVLGGILLAGLFLLCSGVTVFLVFRHFLGTESVEFRIFYILAFLLRAQIPLSTALSQCLASIGESKAGRALVSIKQEINSGVPLSKAFEHTSFFTPFVIGWLTITDDQSGAVKVFSCLTDYFRQKDQRLHENLSRLIEPVVIVITGIYLLILVQTAILPILTRSGGFL